MSEQETNECSGTVDLSIEGLTVEIVDMSEGGNGPLSQLLVARAQNPQLLRRLALELGAFAKDLEAFADKHFCPTHHD